MKKVFYILSIVLLALVSCKKDDVKVKTPVFNTENIVLGTTTVQITVKCDYSSTLKNVNGVISANSDMSDPQITAAEMQGLEFIVTFTNLNPNTKYYYYYEYANGMDESLRSDIWSLTTNEYSLPIVTTADISSITTTSAICGGDVTDDGGSEITSRGVCWSENPNPTINDNYSSNGNGSGSFTSTITNLIINTTYYVRAYATNIKGTSYGREIEMTTLDGLANVTTKDITNIKSTTAEGGGYIIDDDGYAITARGICWSTSQNPTIESFHTVDGEGIGYFSSNMTDLIAGTTYYVRAYAENEIGISYGDQKSFITLPTGALSGLFSVSSTKQVYFSQGNLQYQASTDTWRFADRQWIVVGDDNENISSTYSGWIDLFCWGTSGYNHGAVCYQPWSTNITTSYYYAYGNVSCNLYDHTGKADWGYNAISNGGNTTNKWRTLTRDEWVYVFNTRNTISGIRYAKAIVYGVNGIIIIPDNFNASTYNLNNTNNSYADYSTNIISIHDWITKLEANGVVFLPTTGSRDETYINPVNDLGRYWSSTHSESYSAYNVCFNQAGLLIDCVNGRSFGYSVRLVQDYNGK